MAFQEVANLRQAAAIVYADDINPRLKRAVCFAGDQFAQNPDSRLYLPFVDFEMGAGRELRLASAAGNFQVQGVSKVHFDNGFNTAIATETPGIERLNGGGRWANVPLTPIPYGRPSREGREVSYTAYDIGYASPFGNLNHRFESNLGWGKGDYTFTNLSADAQTFRFRLDVLMPRAYGVPYFMRDVSILNGSIVDRGRAYAIWTMPNGKTVTVDFHDMVRTGSFDVAESVFSRNGATLYSLPFTLQPGTQTLVVVAAPAPRIR